MKTIKIENIEIPEYLIKFKAVRSSGPGGQNVNKVNSKAILTLDLNALISLTPELKERIFTFANNRINDEGILTIASQEERSLIKNQARALEKLRSLLVEALYEPSLRLATLPTPQGKTKRLKAKKEHSQKKSNRQWKED